MGEILQWLALALGATTLYIVKDLRDRIVRLENREMDERKPYHGDVFGTVRR